MKKIITSVVAFALALTVVAPVAASAQSSAVYTFTTNLTIGSRGNDVVALQTWLEAKGLLTIPSGTAKGYFGALTKSAVAAYQAMKGITPAAGYFGPITRQAVMAEGMVTGTPGCPAGAVFNSVTGAPCTGTPPATPGCPAGALYNSMTGAACSGQTGPINTGVEGTLDVRLAATPADNQNIQTSMDVPVYGLELKARLADVAVQTVDLEVAVTGSSVENPGTLINTIKVWDGSTVLATIPVNTTTFQKDSSSVWYLRISGLNFVVPKDATKFMTFSFSTNSSIDTNRTVVIDGYGTNSLRTVSGNGVNSLYNLNGLTRSHTFKKPGNSTVTVSVADREIRSMNIYASSTTNVTPTDVALTQFNVKSTLGDSVLTKVTVTLTSTTTNKIQSVSIWDGSNQLTSRSVTSTSNGVIALDNIKFNLPKDAIKTLVVKGTFGSDGTNASTIGANITSFDYDLPNGSSVTAASASVTGAVHRVYTSTAEFALVGTPTVSVAGTSASGSNSSLTAVFKINVTPRGSSMALPGVTIIFATTSDRATAVAGTDAVTVASTSVAVTAANGQTTLSENGATELTVTATKFNDGTTGNGQYFAFVKSIHWSVAGNTVLQTHGLEEYKTVTGVPFVH